MSDKCPICGRRYERIAQHWSLSKCGYPDLPEEVKDSVYGVLTVKNALKRRGDARNNRVNIVSEDLPYLNDYRLFLGLFSHDWDSYHYEDRDNAYSENQTVNELRLKPHPELNEYPNFKYYTPNNWDVYLKGLFIQGSVVEITGSKYYQIQSGKRKRDLEYMLDGKYGTHKTLRRGADDDPIAVLYQIPLQKVKPVLEMDWPAGWWNDI